MLLLSIIANVLHSCPWFMISCIASCYTWIGKWHTVFFAATDLPQLYIVSLSWVYFYAVLRATLRNSTSARYNSTPVIPSSGPTYFSMLAYLLDNL